MINKFPIVTIALSLTLLLGVTLTQAGNAKNTTAQKILLFNQAQVTLIDAITAAELNTGGRAMAAELDDESVAVQFTVAVLKDGKIQHVFVDGKTGQVLKVIQDEQQASQDVRTNG